MHEEIDGRFRFTPEFRLLVACSWVAPPSLELQQAEQITALCGEGITWDEFIALVDRHRIPALAYAALRRHAGDLLPDNAKEQLKERSDLARREALRHAAEFVRLERKFTEQRIDLLPLKGPMLSLQLFGDPGMRHTRDLDLMVRPNDLARADLLLREDGYRRFPDFELTEKRKSFLMANGQDFWYDHDTRGIHLELHWRSYLWTPERIAELWEHCRPTMQSGVQANCLDDDALLLFLCDHGARHRWFRLKWLSDVAIMIARESPQGWDNLLALAGRLDLRRPLAQSALLVHRLYGVPLAKPLSVLIGQEKTTLPLGLTALREILMSEETHGLLEKRWGILRNYWYEMRLRNTPPYRSHLNILLISIADFKEFPLPDRLFWLYLPLRPLFWLWRHFPKKVPISIDRSDRS